jgi:hypothetical protein
MKFIEIVLWDAIFWLLYWTASVGLWAWTGQGDLLGILVIGTIMTLILTAYLLTQECVLIDDWEPAIVHREKPVEVHPYVEEEKEPRPEPASSTRPSVGFEPGTPMRTDVDLGVLDGNDDDSVS